MDRDPVDLFNRALKLPSDERLRLADLMYRSVSDEQLGLPDREAVSALHPDWDEVIDRRIAEVDAGLVETVPWETIYAEAMARLNDRPQSSSG